VGPRADVLGLFFGDMREGPAGPGRSHAEASAGHFDLDAAHFSRLGLGQPHRYWGIRSSALGVLIVIEPRMLGMVCAAC
jgi:hypothetical protein